MRSSIHSLVFPYIALWVMFVGSPSIMDDPIQTASWPLTLLLALDVGYYVFDMVWMLAFPPEFYPVFFAHHVVALATYGTVYFTGCFHGIGALTYLYHIPTVFGNILTYYTNIGAEQSAGHRAVSSFMVVIWVPFRLCTTIYTGYTTYVHWDTIMAMPIYIAFLFIGLATGFMAIFNTLGFVQYLSRCRRAWASSPSSPSSPSSSSSSIKKD